MKNKTIKFFTIKEDAGKRLDKLLTERLKDFTRSYIKKIILGDNVQVNKIVVNSPSKKIFESQNITVSLIEDKKIDVKPQKIKLDIVFEDNDLIIINKSAGMVVHPGAGNHRNTLVNALIHKYKNKLSSLNGSSRPGIVHRIDKQTSGLLVVAKNNFTHSKLGEQFSNHSIQRKYIALIWGVIRPLNGSIVTKISRSKKNRQLMEVNELRGKNAITNYKTLRVFNIKNVPRISLIECSLETGRTHQIRVHMKYKKVNLIGDQQYGKKNLIFRKIDKDFEKILYAFDGQALHAQCLGFAHPRNNKKLFFEKGPPRKFKKLLNFLEKLDG